MFNKRSVPARRQRRHIHDDVTQLKEAFGGQWFGKEICQICICFNERDANLTPLHRLSHEEMAALDMLSPLVVLRIVS